MTLDPNAVVKIITFPPIASKALFASLIGRSEDTVRGWMDSRTIPTVKMGRQRFVDVDRYLDDKRKGKTVFSAGDYKGDE